MSYGLDFWKAEPNCTLSPQEIHENHCEGDTVDGLMDLPIDSILDQVRTAFPDIEDDGLWLHWAHDGSGAFQLSWSYQHLRIDSYSLDSRSIDTLLDIMASFGLSFYDPQTQHIYESQSD